jgi:plasmid stabilization system protein ParE
MPPQPKPVKLHSQARIELRQSVAFYRSRGGERWADAFKQRVNDGLRAIACNPQRYPPTTQMPGVKRIRIEQFPFALYYIDRPDFVWVVAVAQNGNLVIGLGFSGNLVESGELLDFWPQLA